MSLVLIRQVFPTNLRISSRKLEFDVSPTPTREVGDRVDCRGPDKLNGNMKLGVL